MVYKFGRTRSSVPLDLDGHVQCTASLTRMRSLNARTLRLFGCIVLQNKNSLGQDPCIVGSELDASCRGLGKFTLTTRDRSVVDRDFPRHQWNTPTRPFMALNVTFRQGWIISAI